MGGGSSKNKSWSKSEENSSAGIWGEQAAYMQDVYSRAQGRAGADPYSYGASRIADLDPRMQQALGAAGGQFASGQEQLGQAGQVLGQADAAIGDTLGGKYLDPSQNTSLERTRQIGARGLTEDFYGATNALGSSMEAAGRTGSGAHAYGTDVNQRNLATGLGDMNAALYGQNYQSERDRMMGAASQAGGLAQGYGQQAQAGWGNVMGLAGVGNIGYQRDSALAQEGGARHMFGQTAEDEQLMRYQQMLGGPVMTSRSNAWSETRSKGKSASGGLGQ